MKILIVDDSDAYEPVVLGPMAMDEAIQLLASKLGIAPEQADPVLLEKICNLLNRMPLPLVTVANAGRENGLSLEQVYSSLEAILRQATQLIMASIERGIRYVNSFLASEEQQILAMAAAIEIGWELYVSPP